MNFAAEPQKRCEAGHYKVLVTSAPLGPVGSIAAASYQAGGATYALRPVSFSLWRGSNEARGRMAHQSRDSSQTVLLARPLRGGREWGLRSQATPPTFTDD